MSIPDLSYHRPATLAEACALGKKLDGEAAFLAGGTDLLPDYHREREPARVLISLGALEDLRGIRVEGGALSIGALASIASVAASPLVRAWLPALAEAAAAIASPPVRNLATIGGNFCRAVACADAPPAAIAGGALVRIAGPAGERTLDAERFFIGPRKTVLAPGEVLTAVVLPEQPPRSGSSYQRFARRAGSSLAVAAVAARVVLDEDGRLADVRLVPGAVAPVPSLARRAAALLEGAHPSSMLWEQAAEACAADAMPISDLRGSEAFRRRLVSVLARRALAAAVARAQAGLA
jgi:carbon-monoxide dehydrogenase medium subunit